LLQNLKAQQEKVGQIVLAENGKKLRANQNLGGKRE